MKTLNGFLGLLFIIVILRFILPNELGELAKEILIKFLNLISYLLDQISP